MSTATKTKHARIGPRSAGVFMTPAEFDAVRHWNRNYRYELIRGVLVVAPIAGAPERNPNDDLGHLLRMFHDLHPNGSILNLTLPEQNIAVGENRRRADRVVWVGLGRMPDPDTDLPAIIIEFVSASKRDWLRDYEEKRDEYLAIGVREYWVIDRFARTMTVFKPGLAAPIIVLAGQTYQTDLLPGFSLPLSRILAQADAWPSKNRQQKPPAGGTS